MPCTWVSGRNGRISCRDSDGRTAAALQLNTWAHSQLVYRYSLPITAASGGTFLSRAPDWRVCGWWRCSPLCLRYNLHASVKAKVKRHRRWGLKVSLLYLPTPKSQTHLHGFSFPGSVYDKGRGAHCTQGAAQRRRQLMISILRMQGRGAHTDVIITRLSLCPLQRRVWFF